MTRFFHFLLISLFPFIPCRSQDLDISCERQDDLIIVRVGRATFTCYRFGTGQKYPYFYPVNGPKTGSSLTTESSLPWPHHRSLWFGCDRVNSGNYWQEGNERGQIVSRGARITENGPRQAVIEDVCDWRQPGEDPVITDTRRILIQAPSGNIRTIDFLIDLRALTDVHIEKSNHSLFAARMKDSLSVSKGGNLFNAEGKRGEKETAGINSPWCDYSGSHFGIREGIAIFDHPANIWYPSPWFTRDYGFFSPTGMNWLGEKGFDIRQGDTVSFRYRVVVHAGGKDEAGIQEIFGQWVKE